MTYKTLKSNQRGFTIVELLVATAVLSTILLLVTIVMVGIGNLYFKGMNVARAQSGVRTLTDELSQKIQLSDGTSFARNVPTAAHPIGAICIGTTRYSYVLNKQQGADDPFTGAHVEHVLWRDQVTASTCRFKDHANTTAGDNDGTDFWSNASLTGGDELMLPHARLTSFDIVQQTDGAGAPTGSYSIKVGIAYGDSDLLCNSTVTGDCEAITNETTNDPLHKHRDALTTVNNPYDIICRGHTGDQFCATSALQTSVVQRIIKQD